VILLKEKLDKGIIFIRFAYWIGAIMNLLVAISMTLYVFFELNIGMDFPDANLENRYMLVAGMALMWGWTALLIWGDRKPVERKMLLLLTAMPVVILYFVGDLVLFLQGAGDPNIASFVIIQSIRIVLLSIFISSYFIAWKKAKKKT
jgi:preprotein translocase subunit SecF